MADVKITALKNGPFKVQGKVDVVKGDGTPIPSEKDTIFLCRCGASVNKPFCDGTHSRIGFEAAEEVVPESSE